MATYNRVTMHIERGNGYGRYIISARYKNDYIECVTTDSECFDWLEDTSNRQKHSEALRTAYNTIRREYQLRQQHK